VRGDIRRASKEVKGWNGNRPYYSQQKKLMISVGTFRNRAQMNVHRVLLFIGYTHHQVPSNYVALISEQKWHDHGAKTQEMLSKLQVDSFFEFQQL